MPVGDVQVVDVDTGRPCPPAIFDEAGRVANAGGARAARFRDGRYHSGDLGYRDTDGFLWFAGRTDDWLHVGGENFAAAPVQRILARHPDVVEAVVVGVSDPTAGDQVLAVLVGGGGLDVANLSEWLRAQPDLSPRWWPQYVRVVGARPLDPRR